jgi:hypothetical protein
MPNNLNITVDFTVLNTGNPKEILIGDKSSWGVAEKEPAYFSVIPPGSKKEITLHFTKNSIFYLNSVNLGLSCVSKDCSGQDYEDLADGVWEFRLRSKFVGQEKTRWYLKDDTLRTEIDKIRIKQGFNYDPKLEVLQTLDKTEFLLDASHSFVRQGDFNNAMKGYEEANKLIKKSKNCK